MAALAGYAEKKKSLKLPLPNNSLKRPNAIALVVKTRLHGRAPMKAIANVSIGRRPRRCGRRLGTNPSAAKMRMLSATVSPIAMFLRIRILRDALGRRHTLIRRLAHGLSWRSRNSEHRAEDKGAAQGAYIHLSLCHQLQLFRMLLLDIVAGGEREPTSFGQAASAEAAVTALVSAAE